LLAISRKNFGVCGICFPSVQAMPVSHGALLASIHQNFTARCHVGLESQVIFPRAAQEMKSFPNIQMLPIGAVTLALGAAAVPVALGIVELGHLRGSITKIERAVSDVKLARDVIDKASQSLVNFTAVALDLSPSDRSKVLADAERQFNELDAAVERVTKSGSSALSLDEQQRLTQAVASLTHSWEELRDQAPGEITSIEKSYHFLRILEPPGYARHLLLTFEAEASQAAQNEAAASFDRLGRSALLLVSTMLAGSRNLPLGDRDQGRQCPPEGGHRGRRARRTFGARGACPVMRGV
jgi:hypothetical protein